MDYVLWVLIPTILIWMLIIRPMGIKREFNRTSWLVALICLAIFPICAVQIMFADQIFGTKEHHCAMRWKPSEYPTMQTDYGCFVQIDGVFLPERTIKVVITAPPKEI